MIPAIPESIIGFVLTVFLAIIVFYFAFKLGKKVVILLLNSFVGLVLLVLVNFLPQVSIEIGIWSVLIVALGGIPGLILLILLNLLGIAF